MPEGVNPLSLASSAIQIGAGIGETAAGLIGAGKLKREAAALQKSRPVYNINPNVGNEVALSESELANGMGADATKAYEQGIDKDLSSSLDAILKSGGSANNIADVFDNSQEGRQRLAIMKDNLRLNQINNLVNSYRNQTNETDKAFQFNEYAPWADKVQANAEARKAKQQMVWNGINTIASGGMNLTSQLSDDNKFNDYFNSGGNSSYVPTHNPSIIRDNSLAPISNAYDLSIAAPQTIDMNLQPSVSVLNTPMTPKYNLPQPMSY
jgi:hypothetical protein